MKSKSVSISVLLLGSVLLTGCGRQPTGAIQPAVMSDESFVTQGDYEMHYNAVRTDQLTADIARSYGIERSKTRVLLNVSVLGKPDANGRHGVDATVTVNARNLNAQTKDIQMRRIAEANAVYYIGEVSFSGSETLVFDISAAPADGSTPITATLTREFFAD